ncbi:hypothetical protein ACFWJM_38190, partial [Streptomyces sp. NPDC127077]
MSGPIATTCPAQPADPSGPVDAPATPAGPVGPEGTGPAEAGLLLLVVAEGERDARADGVDASVVLRAAGACGLGGGVLDAAVAAGHLRLDGGRIRLLDTGLARAVRATAPPARRRAAHRLLADAHAGGPSALPCRGYPSDAAAERRGVE